MRVFGELTLGETGRSAAAVASKSLTKSRMLRNRFFGGCIGIVGRDIAVEEAISIHAVGSDTMLH